MPPEMPAKNISKNSLTSEAVYSYDLPQVKIYNVTHAITYALLYSFSVDRYEEKFAQLFILISWNNTCHTLQEIPLRYLELSQRRTFHRTRKMAERNVSITYFSYHFDKRRVHLDCSPIRARVLDVRTVGVYIIEAGHLGWQIVYYFPCMITVVQS